MIGLASLNKLRWYARLPVKWSLFGLTVLAVCYPYPHLLVRHLGHWRNPNALIEPDAPSLQPFVEELGPTITPGLDPKIALRRIEQFVYLKVPYEWDWNTWGVSDYFPTVAEVLDKGREDCDGRAVVAASLLRKFGFRSRIVTDFSHVWVKTDQGETMGPGKRKAVEATEHGLAIDWKALVELPRSLAYGVAVFPALRQWIVVGVLWLLTITPGSHPVRNGVALALFLGGLHLLRAGGADYERAILWMQACGAGVFALGLVVLWVRSRRRPIDPATNLD